MRWPHETSIADVRYRYWKHPEILGARQTFKVGQ